MHQTSFIYFVPNNDLYPPTEPCLSVSSVFIPVIIPQKWREAFALSISSVSIPQNWRKVLKIKIQVMIKKMNVLSKYES